MAPRKGWKKNGAPCAFNESISLGAEEWRPVVGWERYYRVSSLGRVYSLHQTGRLITGMLIDGGYRVIKVRDGERRGHLQVHCMVLEAFVGPRPPGHQGCHRNGDSANCHLDNLRWDTPKGNQADRLIHGTAMRKRGSNPLTAERVRQIRLHPEITLSEWAEQFGCTTAAIAQARRGATWADLDVPPILVRARSGSIA